MRLDGIVELICEEFCLIGLRTVKHLHKSRILRNRKELHQIKDGGQQDAEGAWRNPQMCNEKGPYIQNYEANLLTWQGLLVS